MCYWLTRVDLFTQLNSGGGGGAGGDGAGGGGVGTSLLQTLINPSLNPPKCGSTNRLSYPGDAK